MKNEFKEYTRDYALTQVGPGWGPLVHKIYDKITTFDPPIYVECVKEKWGGLRVYTYPYHQEFDEYVTTVCQESFSICETCGSPGILRRSTNGWYRTLCDVHGPDHEPISEY